MCQATALRKGRPCHVSWAHLLPTFSHTAADFFSHLSCRYVYDHIGGEHSAVIPELVATVATFAITSLWLGPCDIVYLWSILNCFGLNFELWVQKLAEWEPLAQIEVSTEGLGLEVAGSLEGGGTSALWRLPATLSPQSRTFSPSSSWLPGQWLTLWVTGPPTFCGVWGIQACLCWSGPALSPDLSFPSLAMRES